LKLKKRKGPMWSKRKTSRTPI